MHTFHRPTAWRLTLVLAGAVLAGCRPAGRPTPTPPAPGVIFRDDFSATTSGWDQYTGSEAITNYAAGHYVIAVMEPGVDVWARPGLELTDARVAVEAQRAEGPVDNLFGVMCRYSRSGDGRNSFYFFFISSDGYYALGKVVDDARAILSPDTGSFQPSDAIRLEPDSTNQLEATCQGNQFSLRVNGTPVGEFSDDELQAGDIGLIAGTFDEPGVRIHFDNFEVTQP